MARQAAIPLRCRCGRVQGELGTRGTYTRATCYCNDCRAYARWLGVPGLLDEAGGVDVVAMAPSQVRFTVGADQVACMSWSERGIHRWYAACCRTPLGNTPRDPRVHYVGMSTACMAATGPTVDAAFGQPRRCLVSTTSATAPVRKRPLSTAWGILRVALGLAAARLRGHRAAPFLDADGRPIRTPDIVGR